MYDLYSRVASNQERLMMARVRYFKNQSFHKISFIKIDLLVHREKKIRKIRLIFDAEKGL